MAARLWCVARCEHQPQTTQLVTQDLYEVHVVIQVHVIVLRVHKHAET